MESPSVAIVILNWNGENFLKRFLPSVLRSSYPNFRVVVGDNASTDHSVSMVRSEFPDVEVIINDSNLGFAGGYNTILEKIEAAYYILLNSDVEVSENWIQPVIEQMEADRGIAICQPKILDWNHKERFEYAGAAGGWIDSWGYPFCRGRIFDQIEKDLGQFEKIENIFWASGAALFIRSSVFKESGGFDSYFFAHMEEIDLCWRIQRMGYQIQYIPQSIVYHIGGGTLHKENPLKTYLNYRNNLIMLSKNLPDREKILKIPGRMILDMINAFKNLISGNFKEMIAIIKSHFSYLKWEWNQSNDQPLHLPKPKNFPCMYSGNIVWQYFVKGKKTFHEIVRNSN